MPSILIYAGLLHLCLLVAHGMYIAFAHGILWGTGRRADPAKLTDLDRRFERTIANNVESMIVFVPVFLGAFMLGTLQPVALLAAQTYVAARLVFSALYLFNVPYVRTMVWFLSVACIAIIAGSALV